MKHQLNSNFSCSFLTDLADSQLEPSRACEKRVEPVIRAMLTCCGNVIQAFARVILREHIKSLGIPTEDHSVENLRYRMCLLFDVHRAHR